MQTSLQAFEPGTARAQEWPQHRSPKIPRGAFCAVVRADSESARENGPRGGPRSRNSQLAGSNPRSATPQSAQSFAIGAREPSSHYRWVTSLQGLSGVHAG
eukprot:745958-Alexandrium_andersonii.AAC.1